MTIRGIERFSLQNRRALVTGASRGIGRAIAVAFAEAGADVAICARSVPALEEVAGEICTLGRLRRADQVRCDAARRCYTRCVSCPGGTRRL